MACGMSVCVFDTCTVLLMINCYCFRCEIAAINISFYCTGFEILAVRNYLDSLGGFTSAGTVLHVRCQNEPHADDEGCIQDLFKSRPVSVTCNHKTCSCTVGTELTITVYRH
jgi:hypothetical protein